MFVNAGLPAPKMRFQALIGGGENAKDVVLMTVTLARTPLPEMERLGVVAAAEVGIDSLTERMLSEAVSSGSVLVGSGAVGAWCRV